MKMRLKRALCLLISFLYLLLPSIGASDPSTKHEKDVENVLLGRTLSDSEKKEDNKNGGFEFRLLEHALYLCVDQMGSDGQGRLDQLREHVDGLPVSISEFSVPKSSEHQKYTHLGWDYRFYTNPKAWEIRKNILLATVSYVFNLPGEKTSTGEMKYPDECVSIAKLLYYIHILGDHVSDSYDMRLNLLQLSERGGTGLLKDLRKCLRDLFSKGSSVYKYSWMIARFSTIQVRAKVNGENDSLKKYGRIQNYAKDTIDLLKNTLHKILKNTPLFEVFKNLISN